MASSPSSKLSQKLLPVLKRRFDILGILGQGRFGTVYRARDLLREGQECALKVATLDHEAKSEVMEMFRAEFRILSALEHPNIARVYDFGPLPSKSPPKTSMVFFTSEYVPGQPLFEDLKSAELPEIVRALRQITEGLIFLAARNIVHRDLKSSNILVNRSGGKSLVKIVDFGISVESLTKAAIKTAGTLEYMAPEVLSGKPFDSRSDLYSLGVIAYYLITRQFPFQATNLTEMLELHRQGHMQPLEHFRKDLPASFVSSIQRLLAVSPTERFFSAEQFLDELNRAFPEASWLTPGMMSRDPAGQFPHLIARDEELKALDALFDGLSNRSNAAKPVCFVLGDQGFGKSKLLKSFKTTVQLKGGCVLEASKETFANGMKAVVTSWLDEISSYFPSKPKSLETADTPSNWMEFIAVCRELSQAGVTGITVLLDNFDDFETSTLESLHELIGELKRAEPRPPLLIVAARKPESASLISATLPLHQVLEDADTAVLRLRPFDVATIENCLSAIYGAQEKHKVLAEQILNWTGGHPLLVKESVLNEGKVGVLSHTIKEVFDRRLQTLSSDEELVCNLLAVLAEATTFQELRDLISVLKEDTEDSQPLRNLLQTFNRLQGVHVLRSELFRGNIHYLFEQESLREMIYQKIRDDVRIYLHRFIASYFENQRQSDKNLRGKILKHRLRGRDLDRVLELLPDELLRCEHDADYRRAISILEEALQLLQNVKTFPAIQRIELIRQLARFCVLRGELAQAASYLSQVRQSPEFATLSELTQISLLVQLAEIKQLMLLPKEATACLDEAEFKLKTTSQPAESLRVVWIRGRVYYRLGQFDKMRQDADASIAQAMALRLPLELAELLYNRGIAYIALGQRETALRDLLQSLTLFNNSGATERSVYPLNALGLTYQQLGNIQEALDYYKRAYEVAACFSNDRLLINIAMNLATVHHQRGEFLPAQEYYERARESAERTQQRGELARVLKNLGLLSLHFGDNSRANAQFQKCLALIEPAEFSDEKAWLHLFLGDLALRRDDLASARQYIEESLRVARSLKLEAIEISALHGIVGIELSLNNLDAAEAKLQETEALVSQLNRPEPQMVQSWKWAEYYYRTHAARQTATLQIALKHVHKAFDLAKTQRDHRSLWMICDLESHIAKAMQNSAEEKRLLQKAMALAEEYAKQIPEAYRHFFLNSPRFKELRDRAQR